MNFYVCIVLVAFVVLTSCSNDDLITDLEDDLAVDFGCNSSNSGLNFYKQSAQYITLEYIYEENSIYQNYQDSISMPEDLVADVNNRLGTIYDLKSIIERDSIIDLLGIKLDVIESYKKIILDGDPQYSWFEKLGNNVFPTGHETLDDFIESYQYELDKVLFDSKIVILKSNYDDFFNVRELVDKIDESSFSMGLRSVSNNHFSGGSSGMDITILDNGDYNFIFRYGWSDCLSGCIHERFWEFKVDNQCQVSFIKSYGDVILEENI